MAALLLSSSSNQPISCRRMEPKVSSRRRSVRRVPATAKEKACMEVETRETTASMTKRIPQKEMRLLSSSGSLM